jgi:type IV secretory pathway TraG/TraD family ATPase VirD4
LDEFTRNPDTSALSAAFQPWCAGRLGAILNSYNPAIRLERIFEEGWHAYFAIPIGHLQVLANPLGRMTISGLLSVAAWRQKMHPKPGPASVILDEFAEFATPVFASFIATVGSARLWTVLSHQDLGQLKKVKGMDPAAFSSAVFNNTSGCKVCFRTPDPEDAEFWSSTLGTFTTFATTERAQKGLLGLLPTGEMSLREVEQFKVHPNLLKNLAPGRALIFAPGNTDCMARTAAASAVVGRASPAMPVAPETEPEDGMDLASAVDNPGRVRQTHASGRPMA